MSDNQEITKGSLALSKESHKLLTELVYNKDEPFKNKPFTSIVEGFRFAFALGLSKSKLNDSVRKTETISARQFVVDDYYHLLIFELSSSNKSLGGLISDYAEAGCDLLSLSENLTEYFTNQ